eukprot:1182228-Prorocentrum_minimum.AAC.2
MVYNDNNKSVRPSSVSHPAEASSSRRPPSLPMSSQTKPAPSAGSYCRLRTAGMSSCPGRNNTQQQRAQHRHNTYGARKELVVRLLNPLESDQMA